jgi:hypothetical protein
VLCNPDSEKTGKLSLVRQELFYLDDEKEFKKRMIIHRNFSDWNPNEVKENLKSYHTWYRFQL